MAEASRTKDASLEEMLREVTRTMHGGRMRGGLADAHDQKLGAMTADAKKLKSELRARREADEARAARRSGGGAPQLEEPPSDAPDSSASTELCVEAMLAVTVTPRPSAVAEPAAHAV